MLFALFSKFGARDPRRLPTSQLSKAHRVYLAALIFLILGHNGLFQWLVLPHIPLSHLKSSFSTVQFIRNIVELGWIVLILQILDRPLVTWLHRPWQGLRALRAISAVVLVTGVLSILFQNFISVPTSSSASPLINLTLEPSSWEWMLLNSVILTPVREELFFRGILWTLLRQRQGVYVATGLSALLFSASHLPGFQASDLIVQFAFALSLGLLLPSYGLLACIGAHTTVNALALFSHPVAAPLRQWLAAHPSVEALLILGLLTLFFRGLIDWLIACRQRRHPNAPP